VGKYRIDLREVPNEQCRRCSSAERKSFQQEDLCQEALSVVDGLPVRCVGEWAHEKIYRLVQYLGIFAQGMKNKWANKLNYIEICSGPGRCILRERAEEIDGTALAVARSPAFSSLANAIFVDYNAKTLQVLENRFTSLSSRVPKVRTAAGDFTDQRQLGAILGELPADNLNLVFIDPTECNLPFETVRLIATMLRNVDFIINIAVGTDANRNLVRAFIDPTYDRARLKYADFIGNPSFFEDAAGLHLAKRGDNAGLREKFSATYEESLRDLGFTHMDKRLVRNYYYLLFASRHPRGLDFWRKANSIEPDGQRTFDLF